MQFLILMVIAFYGHACSDKNTRNETVTLEKLESKFKSKNIHHILWKDLLSLSIGKRDSETKYGELVGIHKSGKLVRVSIPNCLSCKFQDISRGPKGFLLKGEFTLMSANTTTMTKATIIHWDGKKATKISDEKVSKIHNRKNLITFEISDKNKLKTINFLSGKQSEVQSDNWKDFVVLENGKIIVASSEPWPMSKDNHYFVENGDLLLLGHNFLINTSFISPPSQKEPRDTCQLSKQAWTTFYHDENGIQRSIIPAIGQNGSKFLQDKHQIFVVDEEKNLESVSSYSQIPVLNDFRKSGFSYPLDDKDQLFFDGFNIYKIVSHKKTITSTPFLRIQYKFDSLDYAKRLFGKNHGFLKNFAALTVDGNFIEISRKSGKVIEDSRSATVYKDRHKIENIFKWNKRIYSIDKDEMTLLVSDKEKLGLKFRKLLTIPALKKIEDIRLIGDTLYGISNQRLWKINLANKKHGFLKLGDCKETYNFTQVSSNKLLLLQRCNKKLTLSHLNLNNFKIKKINKDRILTRSRKNGNDRILMTEVKGKILLSYLGKNCTPEVLLKESSKSKWSLQKSYAKPSNIFTSLGGINKSAFSWNESKFIVNGKIGDDWQTYLVNSNNDSARHIHSINDLKIENFLGLSNGQAIVHGSLSGEPRTFIIDRNGTTAIKVLDKELLFLENPQETPRELLNIN